MVSYGYIDVYCAECLDKLKPVNSHGQLSERPLYCMCQNTACDKFITIFKRPKIELEEL